MEIFEDLSFYCQSKCVGLTPTKIFPSAVDELNTPVFEKAPFDYIRQSSNVTDVTDLLDVTTSAEDPFGYKLKSGLSSIDNVNIENNLQESLMEGASRDIVSPPAMGGPTENYLHRGINSNSCNIFYPNNSEYEDIYYNSSDRVTPISTALINDDDEYLPTVGNCSEIYINNSNSGDEVFIPSDPNNEYLIIQTSQFETPDNSRGASECSDIKSPTLKFQIDQSFKSDEIDTPQIIDTLTSIENDKLIFEDPHFNIFNFLTEKDIATSESVLPLKQEAELSKSSPLQIKNHRTKSDDDEDYEPPGIKRRKTTHSINEEGLLVITPRRGRPPKRKESISSEEYCETTGKYREMRDKNNEASRKSRLKRKLKEKELEDDSDVLQEKNIKLRAQVQELEKTVSNFRTNLMQLLLHKR